MWQAVWNDQIIAQSDKIQEVEGNQYFPMESVNRELLTDSAKLTRCSWKGEASYFNIVVNGDVNADAVWVYLDPKEAASEIANHVAFGRGVEVTKLS